jgi:hypothetical protein
VPFYSGSLLQELEGVLTPPVRRPKVAGCDLNFAGSNRAYFDRPDTQAEIRQEIERLNAR